MPSAAAVATVSLTTAVVLAIARALEDSPLKFSGFAGDVVAIAALVVVVAVSAWYARRGELLTTLLAFSFVLTGWQYETGFIVLEPPLIALVACFMVWTGQIAKHRRLDARLDAVGTCALLVVMAAWLSFFGAIDVLTWFKRAMRITWLFGLYLYLVDCIESPRQTAALVRAGLLACAIAGLVMFEQSVERLYRGGLTDFFGPAGTFLNGNEGATYLALFVVLAMALYAAGEDTWLMDTRTLMLVTACAILGIVGSRSRTAAVGTVLIVSLLSGRSKRVRRLLIAGALIVVVTWNVPVVRVFEQRLLGTFGMSGDEDYDENVQSSTAERLYLVNLYWTVVRARPVFGIGAGNYGLIGEIGVELPTPPKGAGSDAIDAYLGHSSHNGFVNWWVEAGTLGVVPFVAGLTCAAYGAWRAQKTRTLAPWWRAVATGVFGGVGMLVITNLTGEFGVSQARYWLFLALASIVTRHAKRSRRGMFARQAASVTPMAPAPV